MPQSSSKRSVITYTPEEAITRLIQGKLTRSEFMRTFELKDKAHLPNFLYSERSYTETGVKFHKLRLDSAWPKIERQFIAWLNRRIEKHGLSADFIRAYDRLSAAADVVYAMTPPPRRKWDHLAPRAVNMAGTGRLP